MAKIRRLNCFDIPKLKKMISYLGDVDEDEFTKSLWNEILLEAQNLLPLDFSFLPESFVLVDEKEILGLITVTPTAGNPYKINISRLIFSNNLYEIGKQLVEFIIARFGSKGATSFVVMVDECHDELFNLFIDGCGFRSCSSEVLWKVNTENIKPTDNPGFRIAQNSDSKYISRLFNSEILPIYRPALERGKNEFKEPFFAGFSPFYKNRYVMEEPARHKIIAYLSITTGDNTNFVIDSCLNDGFEFNYDEIFGFVLEQIGMRKSNFYVFAKQKKYTKMSEKFEEYFINKEFTNIQTRHLLVKDYYKPVGQSADAKLFSFTDKLLTTE